LFVFEENTNSYQANQKRGGAEIILIRLLPFKNDRDINFNHKIYKTHVLALEALLGDMLREIHEQLVQTHY